ncbi:tripartite motif-containing protein 16-like [Dicentrarchus labrax]|uniref:Tripartite motif-containing protein 16-like n=1 Tax=Dicentrarchus labrax TaxID=13489 RepID=A0A8C4DTA4_DICLA|nr:tripartite motif-containing protein 16-like [Dicentrarchus labrax]
MAQQGIQMDQERLCCSICLDPLKDPVTIPCGHSYCMNCIKSYWDEEDQKKVYSCPLCRQTFRQRPALVKNTMLADLVEELKKTEPQAAPADLCYAGPGDVSCDFCCGRKMKALKSCLQCLVSYCEQHLQPHYESAAFEKHKLVDPSEKQNTYFHHNEVAALERTERQRELGTSQKRIQQRIQNREEDVKVLQQELEAINRSADKAERDSEKMFTDLIHLIEKRSSDVKQEIRSQKKTEVSRVRELQEKLQQEIAELRRKDAELEQLLHTEDHTQFLHNYTLWSQMSESTDSLNINIRPLSYFKDVMVTVSEARDKLQDMLSEEWTKISLSLTEVDVLLPQEPKTRAEFLQYSHQITLDPNTANTFLIISEGNRKATVMKPTLLTAVAFAVDLFATDEKSPSFINKNQVLSRESLTGRCYWEVEWSGAEVSVAVTYKDIRRTHDESEFGHNDKSWALQCVNKRYEFRHNKRKTSVSGPQSSRVGVYLDHRAGLLSFYSVSETMTLLHRVQTTFTQPLCAGLKLDFGSTAELCELK